MYMQLMHAKKSEMIPVRGDEIENTICDQSAAASRLTLFRFFQSKKAVNVNGILSTGFARLARPQPAAPIGPPADNLTIVSQGACMELPGPVEALLFTERLLLSGHQDADDRSPCLHIG